MQVRLAFKTACRPNEGRSLVPINQTTTEYRKKTREVEKTNQWGQSLTRNHISHFGELEKHFPFAKKKKKKRQKHNTLVSNPISKWQAAVVKHQLAVLCLRSKVAGMVIMYFSAVVNLMHSSRGKFGGTQIIFYPFYRAKTSDNIFCC